MTPGRSILLKARRTPDRSAARARRHSIRVPWPPLHSRRKAAPKALTDRHDRRQAATASRLVPLPDGSRRPRRGHCRVEAHSPHAGAVQPPSGRPRRCHGGAEMALGGTVRPARPGTTADRATRRDRVPRWRGAPPGPRSGGARLLLVDYAPGRGHGAGGTRSSPTPSGTPHGRRHLPRGGRGARRGGAGANLAGFGPSSRRARPSSHLSPAPPRGVVARAANVALPAPSARRTTRSSPARHVRRVSGRSSGRTTRLPFFDTHAGLRRSSSCEAAECADQPRTASPMSGRANPVSASRGHPESPSRRGVGQRAPIAHRPAAGSRRDAGGPAPGPARGRHPPGPAPAARLRARQRQDPDPDPPHRVVDRA
jgi:hypothetical protein